VALVVTGSMHREHLRRRHVASLHPEGDVLPKSRRELVEERARSQRAVMVGGRPSVVRDTTEDFWDLNLAGTRNVYEAARELGIGKILLCSTMGVYGEGVRESGDPPVITENLSLEPSDYYGLSKRACEEMAAFYYRRHGIRTIAYRLGMFVPESFVGHGFRLLKGGVDDRDVAQAFLLGLDDTSFTFDAFNVMAEVPFSTEELGQWSREPESFLEERYPDVSRLVGGQGADVGELVRMWGFTYWSVEKAKRVLGYSPRYNFPEFFEALNRGDRSHYSYADLLSWGV
jgi:UDP-glucose 4-epimerase